MRALTLAATISAFLVASAPASAGTTEEEVYAAFEAFCLAHIDQPAEIIKTLANVGVKPLPSDRAEAFLAPQKGTAWVLKKQTKFAITLTDKGVCSVSAPYISGKETTRLVEKHLRHRKLNSESAGSQVQVMYAVTFPSPNGAADAHILVMLTTSGLSSIDGVIINAMPESMLREGDATVSSWP